MADRVDALAAWLGKERMEGNTARDIETTTLFGTAATDSSDGGVTIELADDMISFSEYNEQQLHAETTVNVKKGDGVVVTLVGPKNGGKVPVVTGVQGGGTVVQTGSVWIKPSAKNTPTGMTISLVGFTDPPVVVATAHSVLAGTAVVEVTSVVNSATVATIYLSRGDTTETEIYWIAAKSGGVVVG